MLSARTQLVILASATVVWALLVEAGLRLAGVRFEGEFFIPDRELGWALRPNASGWQLREGSELIQINDRGYRDRVRTTAKAPGVYRIAVLGNSWTEAMQVPVQKTFCSLFDRALQGRCALHGKSVEVLNFGVSGYSTAQEFLQLQSRVWQYDPDLVVLAFYSARDVLNNVRELNSAAVPEQAPYYSISEEGLTLDTSYRQTIPAGGFRGMAQVVRTTLNQYSRTAQAVGELLRLAKTHAARLEQARWGAQAGAPVLEHVIYSEPTTPAVRKAWDVTEALLAGMNREVLSHGARFWIITLANRAQVDRDATRRARVLADLNVADLDYADRRIHRLGVREGIPVSSLAPRLRQIAAEQGAYLNGFPNTVPGEGHWNELGHQAAAQVIVDEFCRLFGGRDETPSNAAMDKRGRHAN